MFKSVVPSLAIFQPFVCIDFVHFKIHYWVFSGRRLIFFNRTFHFEITIDSHAASS